MGQYLPLELFIKSDTAFLTTIGKSVADYAGLTWTNFILVNLLSVTMGNVIGGVALVGLTYWFIYLRPQPSTLHRPPMRAQTGRRPRERP